MLHIYIVGVYVSFGWIPVFIIFMVKKYGLNVCRMKKML